MLDTSATAVKSATTEFLQTEEEISFVKERFCKRLMQALDLVRVSAPLAVLDNTGLNDDLNGVEKPISFSIKAMGGQKASVVQSLAKWKRVRLKDFGIQPGKGIVTDMRAMRPDDIMDNISWMNPYYSEYTCLYWAWKNYDMIGNPEYIGFNQYGRLFNNIDYIKDNLDKNIVYASFVDTELSVYDHLIFLYGRRILLDNISREFGFNKADNIFNIRPFTRTT